MSPPLADSDKPDDARTKDGLLGQTHPVTPRVGEGQVKQVLEDKEALAARLHRSPDLLDALLMTFTFSDQG